MPVSLRTMTPFFCIRSILRESTTVIIMGRPSGTATMMTLMASVAAWSSSSSTEGRWESWASISEGTKAFAMTIW